MSDYVDLHVHTSVSDGTVTPQDIIKLSHKQGLKAIAITDHDITDGIQEAIDTARRYPLEVIPGVEISINYESRYGYKKFHMLGFFIDLGNKDLQEALEFLRKGRINRNEKIFKKLNEIGFEITRDELGKLSNKSTLSRVHFAYLLFKKKYVKDIQDAFKKYLGTGCPAYFNRERLEAKEAINLIEKAGGIPVLAHPRDIHEKNEQKIENIIIDLKDIGLMGIEAYYWDHTQADEEKYKKIAERHNLLVSGGSDFHGFYRDYVSIGTGLGDLKVSYELVVRMKERIYMI